MRKFTFAILGAGVLMLSACGQREEVVIVGQETQVLEEEVRTEQTEQTETMNVLDERNALELEQCMDYSTERQAKLAELAVVISEDTERIRNKAFELLDAMEKEDKEAAVELIMAEDWYTVMLADMPIGQRNYVQDTTEEGWRMTILSDELGQHCTAVEYPLSDGRRFYLQVSDAQIRYYICTTEMEGAFVSECLQLSDGAYVRYEGKLTDAGNQVEELVIRMGTVDMGEGEAVEADVQTLENVSLAQLGMWTLWDE